MVTHNRRATVKNPCACGDRFVNGVRDALTERIEAGHHARPRWSFSCDERASSLVLLLDVCYGLFQFIATMACWPLKRRFVGSGA